MGEEPDIYIYTYIIVNWRQLVRSHQMSIAMFGYWRNRQEHSTYCWSMRQFVGGIPNWYRRFLDHITMEKPHPKTLPEWLFWWRSKHFKIPVNCTWTFQKTMKCKSMKIARNFDIRVCLKIRYPKSHLNNAIVHIPFISGEIHRRTPTFWCQNLDQLNMI